MSFWSQISNIDQKLDETSYYELLGVAASATANEIRDRYYKLASKLHPDRYVARSSKENLAALNRIHARMGEAKKVLLNADQRAAYDNGLAKGNTRLEDTTDKPRKLSNRDPANPMARTLYEKAMAEIAAGSESKAKANLTLAKQYEPASKAIADALAGLQPPPDAEPAPAAETEAQALPETETADPAVQESPLPATPVTEEPPLPATPIALSKKPASSSRANTRHEAAIPVRLRIPTWERFETLYTRDISRGGMFLKSNKPAPVGTLLSLNLMMPTGETIEISAEVVHSRGAAPRKTAGMGLRFNEISPETKAQLNDLLQSMPKPKPISLAIEDLVSELVRIRDLPAHEVLGVSENPSREEARVAYEAMARMFHPNRNNAGNDPAAIDICRELIGYVRSAYETVTKR